MKKYVVAYMSLFENIMHMSVVEAQSEAEALLTVLKNQGWEMSYLPTEAESIKEEAFNSDTVIGALEIS